MLSLNKRWMFSLALLLTLLAVLVNAKPLRELLVSYSWVSLKEIYIDSQTGARMYQGEVFSGTAISKFADNRLATEESFVAGRREGPLKRWFENGQLAFESHYHAGRREGVSSSWWSNGNLRSQTVYINDLPDGDSWRWYRTGEKFKRLHYVAGQPVGLQQGWRLNGKLFSNFEYKNGRTYGLKNANLCFTLNDEQLSNG